MRLRLATSSRRSRSVPRRRAWSSAATPRRLRRPRSRRARSVHPTDPGALLPELSRTPEELSVANGVSGTVEGADCSSARWPHPAILTVGPPAVVFADGAIGYVVSASLVVSLPPTAHLPAAEEVDMPSDPTAGETRSVERLNILDGIRVLRQNADVRLVVTLLALRGMVIGALDVLFILLALEVYGTGQPGAGILTGALGVGTMLGGAAAFSLVGRRRLAPALAFAVCLCGIALVATAVLGTGTTAPFSSSSPDSGRRRPMWRSDDPPADDAGCGPRSRPRQSRGFYLFGMSLGSLLVPVIAVAVGIVGPWHSRACCCPSRSSWLARLARDRSTDTRPGARARCDRAQSGLLTARSTRH